MCVGEREREEMRKREREGERERRRQGETEKEGGRERERERRQERERIIDATQQRGPHRREIYNSANQKSLALKATLYPVK